MSSKMYIYNLPFEVNRDLCRLLDMDDVWKELAGIQMKFRTFEIDEIEQTARRQQTSPAETLLTRWGQMNHYVEELFVLLYKMRHVPAMRCLESVVGAKYLRLLHKNGSRNGTINTPSEVDVNGNKKDPLISEVNESQDFIPRPVVEMEKFQGAYPPTSSSGVDNGHSPTEDTTSASCSSNTDSHGGLVNMHEEIIRQVSAIPQLKYEELREATNNWHESNLLGRGGFGQVYKGDWKLLTVAVKRLKNDGKNSELIKELCLNQYRHDNILPLYGVSLGGAEACLVYQLMAGGSLEQRLRCPGALSPLTWTQRHRIAHGVARGLSFLHTMSGTPLIHGDIKPANILLDQCGIPKIGDFGLARKGPFGEERTHLKVSKVNGTRPYLPDEYLRSHCLSPAVDVFSFGVVLLEIATCLPAFHRARDQPLLHDHIHHRHNKHHDLGQLEDRALVSAGLCMPALCADVIRLGLSCTAPGRHARPDMLAAYRTLDALLLTHKQLASTDK